MFNSNDYELKKIRKALAPINTFKEEAKKLSDDELAIKTEEFKKKLEKGLSINRIVCDAFAVFNEMTYRKMGFYLHDNQFEGAYALHNGDLAELPCGEGKSLIGGLCAYLEALSGKGVHVITVNEYLAQRDSQEVGDIHRALGLTVGLNKSGMSPMDKREAYNCDITYTTNSELGFDYLRDNMVRRAEDKVLRPLYFAIIDEADSILIDDARTPLIISGGEKQTDTEYIKADHFVKNLSSEDYDIDIKQKSIMLTESGIRKSEEFYGVDNMYSIENTNTVHLINQALYANYIYKKEVDYLVEDDQIYIIDPSTGRKMEGREWSNGLHQAVQAKEGVSIKKELKTVATISYQNFFRLYQKLSGMTGTAKTEEEEFLSIYNMRVIVIPTNKEIKRKDKDDLVFATKHAKYRAIVEEVKRLYEKGQPVLVGTISVEVSEIISKMLDKEQIHHNVLNAKNHAKEAAIIAEAGEKKAVTIATNMAGRGTDIKLGKGVKSLGGLAVIGSERYESRRIDNQLRGRSGRQGDPGFSQFYVSIEDDLIKRFGSDKVQGIFSQLGDEAISDKTVNKAIESAQKKIEGLNFDVRKTLLDYDNVLAKQRETLYEQRNNILASDNPHALLKTFTDRVLIKRFEELLPKKNYDPNLAIKQMRQFGVDIDPKALEGRKREQIINICTSTFFMAYEIRSSFLKESRPAVERDVMLTVIDREWTSHIDIMDKLRNGIGLRSYGSNNPLNAYVSEGYELFEEMIDRIDRTIISFCLGIKPKEENNNITEGQNL